MDILGRNKQKKKAYDKARYERLKKEDRNYLQNQAQKRRNWRERNPERNRENQKRWKHNHSEQVKRMNRDWYYRTKYGITLKQYNKLLKKQGSTLFALWSEKGV